MAGPTTADRLWDGLQNHPARRADHALQLSALHLIAAAFTAGLVQGTDGNFYGTTNMAGTPTTVLIRLRHGLQDHCRGHPDHAV